MAVALDLSTEELFSWKQPRGENFNFLLLVY